MTNNSSIYDTLRYILIYRKTLNQILILSAPALKWSLREFNNYISTNRDFIPNYGDRYHYGETISTAFVESTVNKVISKRMVKKQQMRWTKKGAHLLLQVRTKTLNNELRDIFHRWYPGMTHTETTANSSSAQCNACLTPV